MARYGMPLWMKENVVQWINKWYQNKEEKSESNGQAIQQLAWIIRMKNIKDAATTVQIKVFTQGLSLVPNHQKYSNR